MGRNRLSQMVLSALVCQGTATLIGISTTDYTITACKRFDLQHLSGIVVHAHYGPLRRCARHAGRDADPADAGGVCEHVRVGAGREPGHLDVCCQRRQPRATKARTSPLTRTGITPTNDISVSHSREMVNSTPYRPGSHFTMT
ncbi:hypothetical protein MY3296_000451 [Beauveria thailandica]